MSTKLSRAMGLALAITGVIVAGILLLAIPPAIVGNGWPLWLAAGTYFGSLGVGIILGAVSGLGVLYWIDTRRSRRAKH